MNDLNEPNSKNFLNWDSVKLPVDQPSNEALGYCCSLILPQPNCTSDNILNNKDESKSKNNYEYTELDLQTKQKKLSNVRRSSISGSNTKISPDKTFNNENNNKAPLVRRGSVGNLNR